MIVLERDPPDPEDVSGIFTAQSLICWGDGIYTTSFNYYNTVMEIIGEAGRASFRAVSSEQLD
jgi:hypothetical protein